MIQKIGQICMTTINRRMRAFFSVKQIRKNARLPPVEEFVGGPESVRFGFGGGNGGGQDAGVRARKSWPGEPTSFIRVAKKRISESRTSPAES
jgi:hypothetical protein